MLLLLPINLASALTGLRDREPAEERRAGPTPTAARVDADAIGDVASAGRSREGYSAPLRAAARDVVERELRPSGG